MTEGNVSKACDHWHQVRYIRAVAAERHADLFRGRWAPPRGAISPYLIFYCFMYQTISILIRLKWAKAFVKIIKTWFWSCSFLNSCDYVQLKTEPERRDFTRSLCFYAILPLQGHATWSRELLANRSDGFKCVGVVMAAEPYWQARLHWLKVNGQWTGVTDH